MLLTKKEYLEDLIFQTSKLKKGDQLYLMTMAFDQESHLIAKLMREIVEALKRRVDVVLLIDAYEYLRLGADKKVGPLIYGRKLDGILSGKSYKKLNDSLEKIKNLGAKVEIINKPHKLFSSAFRGRSHIKLAILKSQTYIGGVNLIDDDHEDYMLKLSDKMLSSYLKQLIDQIRTAKNIKSAIQTDIVKYFKPGKLLIDRGDKRYSVILGNASELIDSANSEVLFTCQFFPDRAILKSLINASKRGVTTTLVFNHHSKHFFPLSVVQLLMYRYYKLFGSKSLIFARRAKDEIFLHSKILIADNNLVIGSHNMVGAGVRYGTAEVAILCNDSKTLLEIKRKFV